MKNTTMKNFIRFVFAMLTIFCMSGVSFAAVPIKPVVNPRPNPNPEFLRAQQLESQNKLEEAKVIYQRLFESEGTDIIFWKLLLLCDKLKDYETVIALTGKRMEKYPDDFSILQYLSRAYYNIGYPDKGREALMGIIENRWNNQGMIRLVANELVNHDEFDNALELYERGRKLQKSDLLYSNDIAAIYMRRAEYLKAIEEYLKTLDRQTQLFAILQTVIKKATDSGISPETLRRPFVDYLDTNTKSILTARLLSEMDYNSGAVDSAYDILFEAAAASGSPQDVLNFAVKCKSDGHIDLALKAYSDFYLRFTTDSKRTMALLESASIRTAMGDRDGARKDYSLLVSTSPDTPDAAFASLRIIELSREDMTFEGFTGVLEKYASSTSFREVSWEAFTILGDASLHEGLTEEALKAYNSAALKSRQKNDFYEIAVRRSWLYFFTGDYDAMATEIESCMRFDPSRDETNELLSVKILGLQCTNGSDAETFEVYANGHFSFYRNDIESAIESFVLAAADTSCVAAPHAALSLAEIYEDRGEPEKALEWYTSAASNATDVTLKVESLMKAADVAESGLNDSELAKGIYLETITTYPGTVYSSELRRKLRKVVEK